MNIFVDTSALFSLIDSTDLNHFKSSKIFSEVTKDNNNFITSNYVLLESSDCISFEIIQSKKIKKVFAFDKHFSEKGFDLLK